MIFDRYIAHRGLHDKDKGIPENSLAAFECAIKKGYPIELDIMLSKDGGIVVFHDEGLKRMTGIDCDVDEMTANQLTSLRLLDTDEKIPMLTDVLKLVRGRVPLLIELKNKPQLYVMEKKLCRLMEKYKGFWAVQSFNPFRIGWFEKNCPEIERGQLISEFNGKNLIARKISAQPFVWKLISCPTFISCDLRSLTIDVLFDAHDIGAKLITWTANSKELLEEAAKFSRGIIFENCEP